MTLIGKYVRLQRGKITKTVTTLDTSDLPMSLDDFYELLASDLENVPPEHHHLIRVELNVEYDGDDATPSLNIFYSRPETDEELRRRGVKEAETRLKTDAFQRERELKAYREITAKYGKSINF